jgi:hypothetical protein
VFLVLGLYLVHVLALLVVYESLIFIMGFLKHSLLFEVRVFDHLLII